MKKIKAKSKRATKTSLDLERIRIKTYLFPLPRWFVREMFALALAANGEKVILIAP